MNEARLKTMPSNDFLLILSAAQRELEARYRYMEAHSALGAIRRLDSLTNQHAKRARYAVPLELGELALAGRLRRHVASGDAKGHECVFLEAASRIEKLDRDLWKLPAAAVHSSQLTNIQLSALVHDEWPRDRRPTITALQYKGLLGTDAEITPAGQSFVWRLMDRCLDRAHTVETRSSIPIIRMDSELLSLLDASPSLRILDWNGKGFAMMRTPYDVHPEALLHPYYVWQVRIQKSAGTFLRDRIQLPWVKRPEANEMPAHMAA